MIITFPSALEYWLQATDPPSEYYSANTNRFFCSSKDRQHVVHAFRLSLPLHVMVASSSKRFSNTTIICHVAPKNLPSNSLVKLSDSVFIIRPELCFLLAARSYDLPVLVRLANDMCSIYRLDATSSFQQSPRRQITNTKQISSYLLRANNVQGVKKARRAIRYASDNTNSPMESILAAILRLPLLLGGIALPAFSPNAEIHLYKKAAAYLGRETCHGDLVWIKQKLAAEYDSNMVHLTASQHSYDQKRANALKMSGYTVISITWGQLESVKKAEILFLELRRMLGLRTPPDRFCKYAKQRESTLKMLLYRKGSYFPRDLFPNA